MAKAGPENRGETTSTGFCELTREAYGKGGLAWQGDMKPLEHKVALLVHYICVHLTLKFKGTIPAGHGAPAHNLKAKYLSKEQQARYLERGEATNSIVIRVR